MDGIALQHPIHSLLSGGQLTVTKIPLDVIKLMITAGYSVNKYDDHQREFVDATCLYRAIEHHQYDVVRLLFNHNASCRTKSRIFEKEKEVSPIHLIASHKNLPLDLLDLLATGATPHDLCKALCTAVKMRCPETALHLVKLGAQVDIADEYDNLPIYHFVVIYFNTNTFNADLFLCLIP